MKFRKCGGCGCESKRIYYHLTLKQEYAASYPNLPSGATVCDECSTRMLARTHRIYNIEIEERAGRAWELSRTSTESTYTIAAATTDLALIQAQQIIGKPALFTPMVRKQLTHYGVAAYAGWIIREI